MWPEKVAKSGPGRNSINNALVDSATDELLLFKEKLKKNPNVYFVGDKGNREKQGGKFATFPKILALTDPVTETIVEFLLDCDAVGS